MANLRINGIMSGFDTDSMIKDLMKAESSRVNKVKQDKQYAVWQQEGFRDIIKKLRTFQSNYFDLLKPSQNLSSASSFAKFNYSVMSEGIQSTKVSVTANAGIKNKSQTIDNITQLASKDNWNGNTVNLRGIKTEGFDVNAFKSELGTKDAEITLAIGNNSKVIKITQDELATINNVDDLKNTLNTKINAAFGSDYSSVVINVGGELKFDYAGSEVKILTFNTNTETMTGFGFTNGQSSYGYQTKPIGELFGLTNDILSNVSINGTTISLDETDSISKMLEKINGSSANVNMSYDSLRDRFVLNSKTEGSANNISIVNDSEAELFLSKAFGNVEDLVTASGSVVNITRNEGLNAKLSINGVEITQGNNTFTMDGMTFTLKELSSKAININVSTDSTAIVDNIKNFVKEYNDLVEFITTKLSEKKNYDYKPLTDDEREALSDEDIIKWETKAKNGLLRGSSELNNMLLQLRNAIIEPMKDVGINMNQIGISSTSYTDKGKLTIDETKLKSALDNNFDEVVNLFSKKSTVAYTDTTNKAQRYSENGIASRFDDILKDYTRTTRDVNGNKGLLIMKAGIENDTSAFSNEFSKKITGFDDRISSLLDDLSSKEAYYYNMFAKMESALSQMESQSKSLMSQLGG
jgi:flagellar hook-associated protein 2